MKIDKEIAAKFFKTDSGNEPVRDFLKELLPVDRKIIGVDIMTIEMSWPIGYPTVRKIYGRFVQRFRIKELAEYFSR